ncbi:unnamed protein product [Linum trigynum]|uniref:Uncharacterized protein n=1 Tax=Linum trigynum TaxID=586398 RepID=A0AAV2CW27_9ROSI
MEDMSSQETEQGSPKQGDEENAWKGSGARKLFNDLHAEDDWYVGESDSKDVVAAMREDDLDDEVPENDDPSCPTIAFTVMEKQRWRRKWRSALIVTVLGRTFPYPVIMRRLETLWAKCGVLQVSSLSFGSMRSDSRASSTTNRRL